MKRGDLERTARPPSRGGGEAARLARPILGGIGFLLRVYHWPILILVLVYLASGITSVRSGEVALVLRFGRLVGDTPAEQVHRSGLLFALPAPIDEVVRVDVEAVRSLRLRDLTTSAADRRDLRSFAVRDTIDPEEHGYCLTGDRNVLQAAVVVRYRVRDPIAWTLEHEEPEAVVRNAVLSALVQGIGETAIDDVLVGDEARARLRRRALVRAQEECDRRGVGVELGALELPELRHPEQVQAAFREVIDAAVSAITAIQDAERYRQTQLPAAHAEARSILADARGAASGRVGRARGEADAFRSLVAEARHEDGLRERLYREALERAFQDVELLVLPPPPDGERYEDLRIFLNPR